MTGLMERTFSSRSDRSCGPIASYGLNRDSAFSADDERQLTSASKELDRDDQATVKQV